MNQSLTQTAKILTLAVILSVGASYVYAWTAPTATPPGGNVSAPVNVGSASQLKTGGFDIANTLSAINGIFTGNVGIGTASPTARLSVEVPPIAADGEIAHFSAPGSPSGVGYTSFGGGFVGWDYANNGIALNAHGAGGSVGGIFVKGISSGASNVGIGTVSPTEKLELYSGSGPAMRIHSPGVSEYKIGIGAGTSQLRIMNTNGNTALQNEGRGIAIDTSGNVGIGTVSPRNSIGWAGALDVNGEVGAARYYDDDRNFYIDANTTSHVVRIEADGDVCAQGKCLSTAGGGGVTSISAGSGISVSGSTGAVTISSTAAVPSGTICGYATNGCGWAGSTKCQGLDPYCGSCPAGYTLSHWLTSFGDSNLYFCSKN